MIKSCQFSPIFDPNFLKSSIFHFLFILCIKTHDTIIFHKTQKIYGPAAGMRDIDVSNSPFIRNASVLHNTVFWVCKYLKHQIF